MSNPRTLLSRFLFRISRDAKEIKIIFGIEIDDHVEEYCSYWCESFKDETRYCIIFAENLDTDPENVLQPSFRCQKCIDTYGKKP